MKHYLKNKEGDVKYTVDMYCGHPNMVGNSTASVGSVSYTHLTLPTT